LLATVKFQPCFRTADSPFDFAQGRLGRLSPGELFELLAEFREFLLHFCEIGAETGNFFFQTSKALRGGRGWLR